MNEATIYTTTVGQIPDEFSKKAVERIRLIESYGYSVTVLTKIKARSRMSTATIIDRVVRVESAIETCDINDAYNASLTATASSTTLYAQLGLFIDGAESLNPVKNLTAKKAEAQQSKPEAKEEKSEFNNMDEFFDWFLAG